MPPTARDLLDRIERYFADAPSGVARIEPVGGLDVPLGLSEWPFPARPRIGTGPVSADDVRVAVQRQEAAGLPASLEWITERHRELAGLARGAGLVVEELPLLVADDPVEVLLPDDVRLFLVGAGDPQLARYVWLTQLAFAAPGRLPGPRTSDPTESLAHAEQRGAGPEEIPPTDVLRDRLVAGRTVLMVALSDGEPVAVGAHQPLEVDGGEVTEVVGVATATRYRGRGLGAGLTSALVEHARQSADLVFLAAGDDDVARVYERAGFARIGTTGLAERPAPSGC